MPMLLGQMHQSLDRLSQIYGLTRAARGRGVVPAGIGGFRLSGGLRFNLAIPRFVRFWLRTDLGFWGDNEPAPIPGFRGRPLASTTVVLRSICQLIRFPIQHKYSDAHPPFWFRNSTNLSRRQLFSRSRKI